MNCPCETCVTLAMCKSKNYRIYQLQVKCEIIDNYLTGEDIDTIDEKVRRDIIACDIFNVKWPCNSPNFYRLYDRYYIKGKGRLREY